MEIKVHCKYDEMVDVNNLRPYEKNRNSHSAEQIERLAKLLRYQGIRAPIVVARRTLSKEANTIAKGHGTLEAIKLNGWDKAPVVYQDFEDEDQLYAFVQSDNAIAAWSELDLSLINMDLPELGPFDIELLGLKDFVVEPADKYADQDADAIPEKVDAITKPGDLWILGEHRLLCGDSTVKENVERLMAGEKADMVFTDPPYGMNLDTDYSKMGGTGLKHAKVIGDNADFKPELITSIFNIESKETFIFGADYFAQLLPNRNEGSWVVWDKRSKGDDMVGITDGQFGSDFELCWSKNKHKRELARVLRPTGYYAARTDDRACHPTQKPIALAEWFFERWGEETALVVDPYLGSGSTLIACEKTNRKCYGMEIDPHYCDVIVKRFETFSGKKVELSHE
jgi:DNA modification methylase